MSKAAAWLGTGGCVGSSCSLINEILPLLQHFSPLLRGNRAIEKKDHFTSLHEKKDHFTSQVINLIYTTVTRGLDCCDLSAKMGRNGVCTEALTLQVHSTRPNFCQLCLGSLSSPRPQHLSTVTFLKASSHFCSKSMIGKWEMSEPYQWSLISGFVSLPGWIPRLFLGWETWGVF